MPVAANLIGQRFGRLIARSPAAARKNGKIVWACDCDCGQTTQVPAGALRSGDTTSCGCRRHDGTTITHGATAGAGGEYAKFPASYRTWLAMRRRCSDPKTIGWRNYGGRGIRVCDRWGESYPAFFADMGEPPPGASLDRINPDGNYEPDNCRWATRIDQARNARHVQQVEIGGEKMRIPDACEKYGVNRGSVKALTCKLKMSSADVFFRLLAQKDIAA